MKFIDTYEDLKKIKPHTFRQKIRTAVLQPLSFFYNKLNNADRLLNTPRVQFLYIHHVFKDEEPALEKLIRQLSLQHHFISHSEAVNKILSGKIDKPYIAISSDDGLKSNVSAAAILDKFNIKSCFFICPEIIDEKDERKIVQFSKQRLHFPPVEFMTWQDVEGLLQNGHEIGGHTMNHVNLSVMDEADMSSEIGMCYNKIVEKCGQAKHFAYPYGRFFHFNNRAREIVFETGFESCASAERGCHIANLVPQKISRQELLIRRDHIVLSWPLQEIMYFMLRNIKSAHFSRNFSPYNASTDINK
jgi:peptidoglycan/xylan/chitin deacetylase (PgdA/CDA1 family)